MHRKPRKPDGRHSLVACALALLMAPPGHAAPTPERQTELMHLLQEDCGSCHGRTRKGGLGPSLLPEALASTPDSVLVKTVLEGRPGTPMPPWQRFLEEEEAQWLIDKLRTGEGL